MGLRKIMGRMPQGELCREMLGLPESKRVLISVVDRDGPDSPKCQVCDGELGERPYLVPMLFGRPRGGQMFCFLPACGSPCEERLRDGTWEDRG